jgi:hypothetical protein
VLHVLPSPEKLLGAERVKKLTNAVQPLGWYPVKLLLALMEDLDKHAGHYGLLRMGRRRFELSHKTRVPQNSARDVVYGIDEMYHFSNRGRNIGGRSPSRPIGRRTRLKPSSSSSMTCATASARIINCSSSSCIESSTASKISIHLILTMISMPTTISRSENRSFRTAKGSNRPLLF